jgi:predicted porin
LLIWDNGDNSDVYVVDNDAITSVVGFKGSATMREGWKAGYKLEMAVQDASSNAVSETEDDPPDNLSIREGYVYIESERLGRVGLGQQLLAADGVAGVTLANTLVSGAPDHSGNMRIGGSTDVVLSEVASHFGVGRNDAVRYDTPTFYGFIGSATWGDDDYWDVDLRFAREWNSIKLAAAIGYSHFDDSFNDPDGFDTALGYGADIFSGSISIMHVPTGLFASFAAGRKELNDFVDAEGDFFYTQFGVERTWLPYGITTFYGEYGNYNDLLTLQPQDVDVNDSEANRWGIGVVQHFDSAAMDVYAAGTFWDFEIPGEITEDMSTVLLGARIKF